MEVMANRQTCEGRIWEVSVNVVLIYTKELKTINIKNSSKVQQLLIFLNLSVMCNIDITWQFAGLFSILL